MTKNDEFGTFLLGFFVGGLVGASVGLLFAPKAGTETREQIRQKSVEISEQAAHQAEEYRVKAEHILTDARTKTDQLVKETRSKVGTAVKDLQTRAKELGDQAIAMRKKEPVTVEETVAEIAEEIQDEAEA